MSERRRHHIVPQGYLKHWCPEGETVRVNARVPTRSGQAALVGVKSLCVQDWWLAREGAGGTRDLAIEKDLGPVENRALTWIRRAFTDGRIAASGRLDVAYFLASLTARSFALRDVVKQHGADVGEQYLRDHPDAEEPVRWQQDKHLHGDLSLRTIFDLVVPHHAGWLTSMHWALYRDPNAGLFTSDQPVVHVQGARAGDPSTSVSPLGGNKGDLDAIVVALCPSVLLVASWRSGQDEAEREMPDGLCDWYNKQLHTHAKHHLIEPPTLREDVKLGAKWPAISLDRDPERHHMARWTLSRTSQLDDPNGIAFVLADGKGYMPYQVTSADDEPQ